MVGTVMVGTVMVGTVKVGVVVRSAGHRPRRPASRGLVVLALRQMVTKLRQKFAHPRFDSQSGGAENCALEHFPCVVRRGRRCLSGDSGLARPYLLCGRPRLA